MPLTQAALHARAARRLSAVGVRVPAPQATASELARLLDFAIVPGVDGVQHLTCAGDYGQAPPTRMISLRPGTSLEISELTFEIGSVQALQDLRQHLQSLSIPAEPLAADAEGGAGVNIQDPSGISVHCRLAGEALGQALRPSPLRPRRLGHVNLKVPRPSETVQFYVDHLGLRLSEQVGDLLYFLRVSSEHHNLGFRGGAEQANVHHIGLEIHGWESFRVLCDHVAACGGTVEYGPGRHGPGNNLFVYLVEPHSGLRLELYADMAHIHDEQNYVPPRWDTLDRVRTVNRWGPQPPNSYLE